MMGLCFRMGDAEKNQDVYLRARHELIARARCVVGNLHVAEDLVQDCWLRWSEHNYPTKRARPILLRIVTNLAIDWHRRRRVEFEALETKRLHQDAPPDVERTIMARQKLDLIIQALQHLPPKTLLAFRYSRVDGLTLKETGKRLGVSESRASQLVTDAVLRIVEAIED